jgi:nucleoid-associated protein YgaU
MMPDRESDSELADKIIKEQKRQELEKRARESEATRTEELKEMKQRIRERSAAAKAKTYVIEAGDTLAKIAQKVYGDASRWKEIFEANQDAIQNPDMIEVGQKLKIP